MQIKRAFLFCLIIAIALMLMSCGLEMDDVPMFSDISECKNFYSLQFENLLSYDSPELDEYIEGLSYLDFYGAKCTSKDFEFEIFAYKFSGEDDAKRYFTNVTGKNVNLCTNFLISSGISSYRVVVIHRENAYMVKTLPRNAENLQEVLSQVFTLRISELID